MLLVDATRTGIADTDGDLDWHEFGSSSLPGHPKP